MDNREQWEKLVTDLEQLLPTAVEEILRLRPVVRMLSRTSTQNVLVEEGFLIRRVMILQ